MRERVINIQFVMLLIMSGSFALFTGCENSLLDSDVQAGIVIKPPVFFRTNRLQVDQKSVREPHKITRS